MEKPSIRLGIIGSDGHGKTTLSAAIGKAMAQHSATRSSETKPYLVTLRSAKCVGVYAESGDKAKELVEKLHGIGTVVLVQISTPAELPRG
jgi:hypothetical protein